MSYPPQRYTASTGEASATLRPQGHPPELTRPDGGSVHYLATSASTSGEFGLYRWEMSAARSGADPHFHRTISESFYVLRGAVGLYDGRRWTDAVPGDFLFVPPGGIHGFRNESGESAAFLLLFAPGAPREQYFEELVDIATSGRQLSQQEWTDLYARHDQFMV